MSSPENLAVVAHAADDVRLEILPEPVPAADEAVVEIAYGGICGSDLHYWKHGAAGASILREPMVLGHEVVGTVHTAAADGSSPPAGTNVAVHPGTAHADGETRWPQDKPHLAPGATYLGSAARLPHTQGAFARRVALPSRMLRVLPAGLELRTAALAEPASVAWHAVQRAGSVDGRSVAVIGGGPIGLLCVAAAKALGASRIVLSDLAQAPRDRAEQLGADETIDATDAQQIAAIAADVVIEASGSVPGLASAISAALRGGTVIMVGLQRQGEVAVPMAHAIARELDLRGAFRFNDEMDRVLAALADDSLDVDGIVTHTFAARDLHGALKTALNSEESGKVLLDFRG
ncbi:zinc-binding dehydrogenase [Glutamicibacter sp. AOP12-B1-11]|uniref:zinc-binding dehydrogenase n=1 Tax=Glutamicibacter sp. AOP12-B1-11 TaxID=3457725 RepID=UPI0040332462